MALREDLDKDNERLLVPLSPVPQGADASVTTEFEVVKAEIDKLNAISGAGPNWSLVEKGAMELLVSTTKDMRLATWVAAARVQLRGWLGVASGLSLLDSFVRTYWDTMFPDVRRARGRANLYVWYTEQAAALETRDAVAGDAEALTVAEQRFGELDAFLAEKLGDAHPGRGRLHGVLRSKVRAAGELVQAQAPPPPPVAPAPTAPTVERDPFSPHPAPAPAPAPGPPRPAVSAPAVPTAAALGADLDAGLVALSNALVEFAAAVLTADEKEPLGFRLRRIGAWLKVRDLPAQNGGRITSADPKPEFVRAIKDTSQPRWVLRDSEAQLQRYPYWLDPHRVSAEKLDALGFAEARDEVTRLTVEFVQRFPVIVDLSFRDGLPVADDATKAWLHQALASARSSSNAGAGAGPAQDASTSAIEAAATEAMKLVGKGQVADGLAHLVDSALHAGSGRDRFRGMLRAGRLALDAATPDVARAIFQGCLADIDRHQLEVWDPTICSEVYTNLIGVLRKLPRMSLEQASLEASLFERLCRIDPRAAVHLAQR